MTRYNKLIRDCVSEGLRNRNIEHSTHIADDIEYDQKLHDKIVEEARELAKNRSKEELADLLEVIEAVKMFHNWTTEEIEEIRLKKLREKGGFTLRIILEES